MKPRDRPMMREPRRQAAQEKAAQQELVLPSRVVFPSRFVFQASLTLAGRRDGLRFSRSHSHIFRSALEVELFLFANFLHEHANDVLPVERALEQFFRQWVFDESLDAAAQWTSTVIETVIGFALVDDEATSFVAQFQPLAAFLQPQIDKRLAKGELDFTRYVGDRDVTNDFRHWNTIIEFIRDGEMPPEDKPQPTLEERNAVVAAIETILLAEAKKHAGDPGVVLPRRLSNTEYDLSIRDLTGVAIRATAEFPADPAGGEGFDNTGEALGMTPSVDERKEYPEIRFVAVGLLGDRVHILCFSETPDGIRVISFRKANSREVKRYVQANAAD